MPTNPVTLTQLMLKCRQRTDMVNSTFVTDAELRGWMNIALSEVHDILVTSYEDYYIKDSDITLPATDGADLPDDFYKVLGVDLSLSGSFSGSSIKYRMRPYSFQERDAYSNPILVASSMTNTFYNVRGNKIHFIPNPSVAGKARLYYVPEAEYWAENGDDDGNAISVVNRQVAIGWEEYLINSVSIKMILKEEGDPSFLMKMLADTKKRLTDVASPRDSGESKAIRDVNVGTLQRNYVNWV